MCFTGGGGGGGGGYVIMHVGSMPYKTLQYRMQCNYVNQCKDSPQFLPTLPTVQIQHAAHSYIIYNAAQPTARYLIGCISA